MKKPENLLTIPGIKSFCLGIVVSAALFLPSQASADDISLNLKNVTVKRAIAALQQSHYSLTVDASQIDMERRITVAAEDEPIENVLAQIFAGQDVSYEINGRSIVVTRRAVPRVAEKAVSRTLSGVVRDDKGATIVGATVVVKGTTTGVTTDIDGRYSLRVSADNPVLQISFVGYRTAEVAVAPAQTVVDVTLAASSIDVDEVVVVGYGTQSRHTLTTAVSKIAGSAVAAVILGALMAHGIQPGFKIFTASGDLAYTFIMSQFAVNLLMIPVGFVLCQCMARLLSIRLTLVAIGIVVLAFIGAYAISNSLVDIWVVLAFGLVGFFGGKVGMDTGAMALGVILGPMIEENLGKSVDLSRSVDGGLMSVMFEGSINKVLIAALLLSLLTPFLLKLRNRKHAALLPEGPRPGWKTDLFAGIGFLAIAAAFLVQYEGLEGVSRVFPEVLTKLIGAGGAYFVGKGLWRRSREAAEPEGGEAVAWCKIGIICATSLCYAVLIPVFGFLVTTMGFIAGSTLILGDHSRGLPRLARTAIAFAIGFSLLVWAGFTLLLNVPVPEGMFL